MAICLERRESNAAGDGFGTVIYNSCQDALVSVRPRGEYWGKQTALKKYNPRMISTSYLYNYFLRWRIDGRKSCRIGVCTCPSLPLYLRVSNRRILVATSGRPPLTCRGVAWLGCWKACCTQTDEWLLVWTWVGGTNTGNSNWPFYLGKPHQLVIGTICQTDRPLHSVRVLDLALHPIRLRWSCPLTFGRLHF